MQIREDLRRVSALSSQGGLLGRVQTYNDGYVKHHVRDLGWFRGPERVDELSYGASERIRQTCHRRG